MRILTLTLDLPIVLIHQGFGDQFQAAQSTPIGVAGSSSSYKFRNSKWRRELKQETVRLGSELKFLAGLSDHSKILFSEDRKTYKIFDLATGKIRDAFVQDDGVSWVGVGGNTIVSRIGFGENYVFRTFPIFESREKWSPPQGRKADGFAFGARSNEFLCVTQDAKVHQVDLRTLRETSEAFELDKGWDGQGLRPSSRVVRRKLHLKRGSTDLKSVLMGQILYRKDTSNARKIESLGDETRFGSDGWLAGNGNWVSPLMRLGSPTVTSPGSSILLSQDSSSSRRLNFFDSEASRYLFSLSIPSFPGLDDQDGVAHFLFCESLGKVVVASAKKGVIELIDVDAGKLSKIYPVQLSKSAVAVKDLGRFSYRASFSRPEFISNYRLARGSSEFEIDPESGVITWKASEGRPRIPDRVVSRIVYFAADLKGGDEVGGHVVFKIGE